MVSRSLSPANTIATFADDDNDFTLYNKWTIPTYTSPSLRNTFNNIRRKFIALYLRYRFGISIQRFIKYKIKSSGHPIYSIITRYYYRYNYSAYRNNGIEGVGEGKPTSLTSIRDRRRNRTTNKIATYPFRTFIITTAGTGWRWILKVTNNYYEGYPPSQYFGAYFYLREKILVLDEVARIWVTTLLERRELTIRSIYSSIKDRYPLYYLIEKDLENIRKRLKRVLRNRY